MAYRADDVLADTDRIVSPELYEHYGKALRRSVDVTFTQDNGSGLSDRLRANASWFAAHKSAYVMQTLREIEADDAIQDKASAKKMALKLFDRWMDAEVNTATARARTAKQFEEFMQPDNVRLFPNLRWIASRSADPRASHTKFYDRVWAKTDPFWQTNAPGTEWNCKCDIEETDDPVTDNSSIPDYIPPRGLEGNPAETGQLFTENASYVRGTKGVEREVSGVWKFQERERLKTDKSFKQKILAQKAMCKYDGVVSKIIIEETGIDEALHSSFGSPDFVLKNYSLRRIGQLMKDAEYLGWMEVDLHNSKKSPKYRFKLDKDIFLYYRSTLPNGEPCYFHLCRNKFNGDIYLYSLTTMLNMDSVKNSKVPDVG